jgi:hypothetical protein
MENLEGRTPYNSKGINFASDVFRRFLTMAIGRPLDKGKGLHVNNVLRV